MKDGFGASVSYHDADAIAGFTEAARLMLAYKPDPAARIEAVLAEHPDFIMARCFYAGMFLTASDKRKQVFLRREFAQLQGLAPQANDRERGHIRAIELWLSGDFAEASQAYGDILYHHPRDIVALQFGHQTDFLLGQASMTRDRPRRVWGHWSEADEEFSFVLGMQAFGLEEAGHYAQAEEMARRAVALNADDSWSVHALAHCLEMQGKAAEGISFMQGCEAHWGRDSYMKIHNRWHLALYWLDSCDFGQVMALHDAHMQVDDSSELMDMHDSAALLWRLELCGQSGGDRWTAVADRYAEVIDQAYIPFTDLHGAIAFAATGRRAEAEAMIAALERGATGSDASAEMIRMAGLDVVRGIWAFGQGDYEQTKHRLAGSRHRAQIFGGSIAQRDVINLTLLEAARRSGDVAMVEALLAERTAMREPSPLTELFRHNALT